MIRIRSWAKINLHLQVASKREDGYHCLQTVFARVSLHDDVFIEAKREPVVELFVNGGGGVPHGPKNIAFKAARWYLNRFKINWGVKIIINKRIPPGSGLGAGSSNAGAVIRGLAQFFGEWDPKVVVEAVSLGADVPFFIMDVPFAYAEGVGEVMEVIEPERGFDEKIALLYPGFGVSTKEAFELFDAEEKSDLSLLSKDEIISTFKSSDWESMSRLFFNHLEVPVFKKHPELAQNKKFLKEKGALFSLMSGSGSTVYGIFGEEIKLEPPSGGEVFWCEFI